MSHTITTTSLDADIATAWQNIINVAASTLSTPCVMITRLDPPDVEILLSNNNCNHRFPSGSKLRMTGLFCTHVAQTRQKLVINNSSTDPLWARSSHAQSGIIAYLGYPILWPDGDVFGTFCAVDTKENSWGEKYEELLHTFKVAIEAHVALLDSHESLQQKNNDLQKALDEVNFLKGLLPICTSCKKIRDDNGYWTKLEAYFSTHSSIEFSHGICPDCAGTLYPEYRLYKENESLAICNASDMHNSAPLE